jgi:transcriptional regulator with XRE-family HTH domain
MFAYIAMVRHPPTDDSSRDHKLLGAALRQLREQAVLTQRELGGRAQIGVPYLSQLENGHRGVGWHTVTRLLAGIGANLHQLADAIADVEKQQR